MNLKNVHTREGNFSIPELAVNPDKFRIHLTTIDEEDFAVGDSNENFLFKVFLKL
jgi:glutaminase